RLKKMQHSFGGYWRYPGVIDFCYLVNPYFPQPRMVDEMKANFDTLLRNYPSGMDVNSLLASKYFGLRHSEVVVGNGAAELIKSLMGLIEGKIGVAYPTFEEYPNRLAAERIVKFAPQTDGFTYSAADLIDFFSQNPVENLLIVNPDNPSGNFIDRDGLLQLAAWAERQGTRLIVDESFVDFADEPASLLSSQLLAQFPSLCVMKSISKSYGVPGLRLGILASADRELIQALRRDVAIWNINSFGEFYMQIFNKYEKDYRRSCEKFRLERSIFLKELESVPNLRVFPSQANYFLCELTGAVSSAELTLRLLTDFNILIKDCSTKKGFPQGRQFIRLAIRDRNDNSLLTSALAKCLTN
ncbi:MAG: aminotransferase class I/II-fold pyridoxal phosphate-dependent enzyme, partial [Muribaculaceae bacterium]|nr:aminotransferase class I/II-fold pyridoxal phosphate-dependent enzyme [Muribaculaceae bacterium]